MVIGWAGGRVSGRCYSTCTWRKVQACSFHHWDLLLGEATGESVCLDELLH